ncbi:MAG TPA: exonuclease SbcC, partial [Agromyces sp.]|nr:exonuclease SbcC [Agromyces sp.]
MSTDSHVIELSLDELREVAGFAARCASEVLPIFEGAVPGDARPREAIGAALAFAEG